MDRLSPSAKKIDSALKNLGYNFEILELPKSTRTSAEAAEAADCDIGQIAKSLIFKSGTDGDPILIITSGANRVNEDKTAEIIGEKLEKADADFVRTKTGFAIGGVPPLAHKQKIKTFVDQDLLDYKEIWAAAGTPRAIFKLTPQILVKITEADTIKVT